MSVELLDKVSTFKDSVLNQISNRDIITFKLGDIKFDNNINVNGNPLSISAINKILSSIRVKNNFIKYKEQMQQDDWNKIEDALKNANKNIEFWGKRIISNTGYSQIVKLFQRNETALQNDYLVTFKNYFDMIILALEGTTIDFELEETYFDDKHEIVTLRFLDKSTNIDVLQDMSDIWKHGANLTFDLLQFGSAPFFKRQICSNGMVAPKLGFKTNIKNLSFNEDIIQKQINKILMHTDESYASMIRENVEHLRKCDVSLKEFYEYRWFFEEKTNEFGTIYTKGKYNHIISKFFNDSDIIKAYGVDLGKQTDKWLSTATSGRNAYDFFNDITWIASHKSDTGIEDADARSLQERSSALFFKDNFDLEDIAPKVNLKIGKTIINNN